MFVLWGTELGPEAKVTTLKHERAGYNFKKNDKTFQSEKHVSTATSVIFS